MELSNHYDPALTESRWYKHWLDQNYFHSEVDDTREAFTIVIPPPNVTGVLHMGHLLNNTVQDILIRHARKSGKNACWVPGMDHASIATEAKVVKRLREQGIKKGDLTREEFLSHAWKWKEEYGGIILQQLQRLGASCDWDRTRFTMDPSLSKAVTKVFVDQYNKGKLYRGLRMTNWDPEAQTVLSNEEVIHSDERRPLYYVKYKVEGLEEFLTIATVRPETIMGDTAIAVHPEDDRYKHLVGKRVHVPLTNRTVPIIADDYVDREFGTGALKITPAHDVNDNEVGERHNLETIDILNADGTIAEIAGIFVGEPREIARKMAAKKLDADGQLVKTENYDTSVGRSERTGAVVEPRLTLQWFVKMEEFAEKAMAGVTRPSAPLTPQGGEPEGQTGGTEFHPPHFFNMFKQWVGPDKVRDWCISRQLWWGHRIPAWFYGGAEAPLTTQGGESSAQRVFVGETADEALVLAKAELGDHITIADLHQDEDVLDTWFSSWLWPISVFDGFEDQTELAYYYPSDVLVTGWDIIYLWVARMMMAGHEYGPELLGAGKDQKDYSPFKHVYWTGMVRDAQRRKMSKSLGNSPDSLTLLDKYGADGVRYGMLSAASAGGDIIFDAPIDPKTKKALDESQLCNQGKLFCNKMWNALKLIKGFETDDSPAGAVETLAIDWIKQKFSLTLKQVEKDYESFRLNDAVGKLYSFIWGDFCGWFLEMIKPGYADGKSLPISSAVVESAIDIFADLMNVLHPFMPFVTEEIWHQLRTQEVDVCIAPFPTAAAYDEASIARVEAVKEIVSKVREQRSSKGIKARDLLPIATANAQHAVCVDAGLAEMLEKMAFTSKCDVVTEKPQGAIEFLIGTDTFYLTLPEASVDVEAEREKMTKELGRLQGFVGGIEKKLSNERFVSNAPEAVIAGERKKLSDGKAKIAALEESLKGLS
ncbi:MAG: valine--tRNA ligase [Saprospiraceae bacterium]